LLKEERHQQILETLRRDGKVVASDLSATLRISEDTIRRDLRELAEAGLLQRVHGGALPRTPVGASYALRAQQAPAVKVALAAAAARLVRPGQVILLDGGTTILEVARHLPRDLRATVITHSPPVAIALAEHPAIDVIVIGGRLYKESLVAIGPTTAEALQRVRADLCMLGVCSLHPDLGITTLDYEEATVKRIMIAGSAEVVAVSAADKLGTAAPYVVAPLRALTHLVTEHGVPAALLAPYRALGISVVQPAG